MAVQVKDAPVALVGSIIASDDVAKFEGTGNSRVRIEGQRDGVKLTIMSGDGFSVVKLTEVEATSLGFPRPGDTVAWYIRNAAWNVGDGSGMSTRYVRNITPGDLDDIGLVLAQIADSKAPVGK